jgi:hypothetical protein
VHEQTRLGGRISSQDLGGVTGEYVSETVQKQTRVQDETSELPVSIFGETNEGKSLMSATRRLRRVAHHWREMSEDWQMESEQPSWDLTRDQWHIYTRNTHRGEILMCLLEVG